MFCPHPSSTRTSPLFPYATLFRTACSVWARFTYCISAVTLALGVTFFIEFFNEGQLPAWLVKAQRGLAIALLGAALLCTFDRFGLFAFADLVVKPLIVATQLLTAYGIARAIEREPGPAVLYGQIGRAHV